MRFPHRSLRHDQLLRPGRERVEGQTQVQPGGENAPTLRATAGKETRRLKLCLLQRRMFLHFFVMMWDTGKYKVQKS